MLPCDGYRVSRSFCLCSVVSRVLQANGVSPGDHFEKRRWVGDCTETEYFVKKNDQGIRHILGAIDALDFLAG